MKSLAPLLSIIALVCGLVGCSGGGGSGGGGSAADFAVSTTAADFGVVDNPILRPSRSREERLRSPGRYSAESCRLACPSTQARGS